MTYIETFEMFNTNEKMDKLIMPREEGLNFLQVILNKSALSRFKVLINDTPGQMEFIKIKK